MTPYEDPRRPLTSKPYWWRDGPGLPTREPEPENPDEERLHEIEERRDRGSFPPHVKPLDSYD